MTKKIHSITRLILFTRLNHRLLILGLSFLSACLGILSPYFQKNFIDLLVYRRTFIPDFLHINSPLWFIFIAAVCLWISQSLNQLTQYLALRESLFMQKKLAKMLYEKMMELKSDTLSKKSIGEVVSLYATDIPSATVYLDQTLPSGASTFFPLLITPIVLIHYFDTSIVLTLILILIISIFNTFLAFRQSKYFYLFKKLASDRLGIVNEWVQNIRTLRILGWTEIFEFKIIQKRILETDNRVKMVTNGQIMNSVTTTATFFINVCTLGTLVCFSKKILTPGEIFSLLWILGVFLTRPFRQMPWFFTFAFDASTSIKRLESFFKISNLVDPQIPEVVAPQLKEQNLAIQVKGLKLNILNDKILDIDSLEIEKGKLTLIIGEVGCGKTMLLFSLLGETNCRWNEYKIFYEENKLSRVQGLDWKKIFGFVPQEGFIVSTNLRDNILLEYDTSKDFDREITQALVKSEFSRDLENLPQKLDTEFGERGINLSGGQRQRINISRAVFSDAEVLLLDDAFSAIDVETEAKLIERLLLGDWKNKTILMSTHRLTLLPYAHKIIFMKQGTIKKVGTYQSLLQEDADFRYFTQQLTENTKLFQE